MEYQSLASLVLTHPVFAGLVAAVIVFAGYRFLQWRADAPLWASVKLMTKQQYLIARQRDVDALLSAASRQGKRDFAAAQLDELRSRYPDALRLGHLWWTWWQVRGLVSADDPAPPCTSRQDGIDKKTKNVFGDDMPLSEMMKKW